MPAHAKRYGVRQIAPPDRSIDQKQLTDLAERCVALNKQVAVELRFKYVPALAHGSFFPDKLIRGID